MQCYSCKEDYNKKIEMVPYCLAFVCPECGAPGLPFGTSQEDAMTFSLLVIKGGYPDWFHNHGYGGAGEYSLQDCDCPACEKQREGVTKDVYDMTLEELRSEIAREPKRKGVKLDDPSYRSESDTLFINLVARFGTCFLSYDSRVWVFSLPPYPDASARQSYGETQEQAVFRAYLELEREKNDK